ncbi:MAG: hypothetical protein JW763_02165 [candidate division Zixibacteria bacterium]|nr:hypothetical protein [candidate division Zixibacteria bacterium]
MKKMGTAMLLLIALGFGVAQGQITTAQSGEWQDPVTWMGGVVPTSSDDVLIAAGHTVSVDDTLAECHSVTFGGEDALIDMNHDCRLSVYGDFTLFSKDHIVFSAGWSSDSAFIRFTGDEPVQTLSGWNTGGGSTSLRDVIIDKAAGKVVTDASGMRLGLQNSMQIISGTFELSPDDDLEARWASSGNFTNNQNLEITVHADGAFILVSGSGTHFIRSGTGSLPIGKMTVSGEASFTDASSYDISIGGIDIMDGGQVEIGTELGSSSYGPEFNPGTITINDGGELLNTTTTDVWFDTSIVDLKRGGTYKTTSSTTVFPPTFLNDGKVRYQRNSSSSTADQIVNDMDYYQVEFSYESNGTSKIWTLTDNRAVTDSLTINNSANFVLEAGLPQTLTVGQTVRLTSGLVDISDADVTLAIADGALISRATGQISDAPDFLGTVNLRYTSSVEMVTTGPELPTDPSVLNDFTIAGDEGVILGADATVNGTLLLEDGVLSTDAYTLTLGASGVLDETAGYIVQGTVAADRDVVVSTAESFGNMGLEITADGAAPGIMSVIRVTGAPQMIDGVEGIARYFDIIPTVNTGLDAVMVFTYADDELNDIPEGSLQAYSSDDGGATWTAQAGVIDTDANTVTISGIDAFSRWTLGSNGEIPLMIAVSPHPILAIMANAYEADPAEVYVGGDFAPGYTVNDIDQSTVKVNGVLDPLAMEILGSYPGFAGDVMKVSVPLTDFAAGYGWLFDTTIQVYSVSGSFTNAEPFLVEGELAYIGHRLGDVNDDYAVNLLDILYLVDYIYQDGPEPIGGEVSGDCDCTGALNLLDVLALIDTIYQGGPGLKCPQ